MNKRFAIASVLFAGCLLMGIGAQASSQPPGGQPPGGQPKGGKGGGGFGMGGQERKIVKDFDKNKDGWLNSEERAAARESLKQSGGNKGGFGGKGGFGKGSEPGTPGPKVSPGEVKNYPDSALYEPNVLRTIFLDFENKDWEMELQDFHNTDVEVPATMTVDGKKYPNVGVHFRGMSSYMGVGAGSKRSLDVALDFVDRKQRLYGYKTLNLLNSHDDPTMMDAILYSHIARKYIPAPKANFVKVVINGESWGVYVNLQQFDKVFLNENYKTTKGTRWKIRGSPGGRGGLEYIGDDIAAYKRIFTMKGDENEAAWKALINLCKVLNQTPADKLQAALEPIVDIDSLLWFLALDVALINCDGYWIRASDYSLYLDEKGKFHFIPADMNECFRPAMGPGFGGGGAVRMPPPGEIMPTPLQNTLQLTEEQKKKFAELQKEVDANLEKMLTDEQKKQLKELKERSTGGGPGGKGPGGPGGMGPGGPGGMGPGGGGGVTLDPLVGLNDERKPLRSKVLAIPELRAKYLQNVKTIAQESLDWKKLGLVVSQNRALIEKEVQADTRKLDSFEAFKRNTDDAVPAATGAPGGGGPGRGMGMSLRSFTEQRQKFLLEHPELKKIAP